MRTDDVRYLFAYDRWATERLLAALDDVPDALWSTVDVVGERGLGTILVHHLGASQRWRHGIFAYVHEGVAIWQMLAHVVNHGTQHRSRPRWS